MTQNSLTFSSLYHPPTILQNIILFIFVAIVIAVFCVQVVKQLFLYIYYEVCGAFSRNACFFLIILYVTWFCFSKKIACGHPFHYLLIKIFQSLRTNRQGLPENLIFNSSFYVTLCKSLCISNVLAVFFKKLVLTNFAKFTETT